MKNLIKNWTLALPLLLAVATACNNPATPQTDQQTGKSFLQLAKERYSVREYSDQPVEKEKLDSILEAGRIAPTAANKQPQRIYVLQSPEDLAKVDSLTPCRYGAPVVLMFAYDSTVEWTNKMEEGIHSGVEDVSIVATHCMLEATDLGLGSIWVNAFPNTKAAQVFGLPEREKVILLMPIGYKGENAAPSEKHTDRLPMSATVKNL